MVESFAGEGQYGAVQWTAHVGCAGVTEARHV